MRVIFLAFLCLTLFVTTTFTEVMAQEYPLPPRDEESEETTEDTVRDRTREDRPQEERSEHERRGFWANIGLGWGSLGCDECEERTNGGAGGIALGGTINPHFLVGGATYNWVRTEDDITLTVGTLLPVVRYYPMVHQGLFFTGGLGFGMISLELPGGITISEEGGGALVGLGYDLFFATRWAVTLFANAFVVVTDEDSDANVLQLGLGISWH